MLLWWIVFTWTQFYILAGPTGRTDRVVREVYPPEIEPENVGNQAQVCIVGDVVYGPDEVVPAEQPCLECRCQPPEVQCQTIQCIKTPGCKAVHRANRCCPDYQCECQYEGKIYSNGEKVQTLGGEDCKVCYCRGGEVQCADVSCYKRTDCEGKAVPGQCCPRYDHCPIEPTLLPEVNREVLELWSIANLEPNSSVSPITDTNRIPDSTFRKEGAPKITIKEIIPEVATDSDSQPESSEISEIIQEPPPAFNSSSPQSTPSAVAPIAETHILSLVRRKSTVSTTPRADSSEMPPLIAITVPGEIEGDYGRNPAYPPIVDVLSPDNAERILPEKGNKTEPPLDTDSENGTESSGVAGIEKESLEEESGEATTRRSNHSAFLSNENASVDLGEDETEISDMITTSDEAITLGENETATENPMKKDVEVINVGNDSSIIDHEKVKIVGKRESRPDDEADAVFRRLNEELNAEITDRTITEDEHKRESDRIFEELLEESSTPKYRRPPKNKEEEMLQRVSDAIASVTLKKNPFDSNVFGLISNFFGNQNKAYGSK